MLKKFRANFRSFKEFLLFAQIFLMIISLPIMFRLFSIPRLMRMLTPRDLKIYQHMERENLKDKIVKFTDYILNRNSLTSKNICLKRTLVLYHFLRKIGMDVQICLGVKYNTLSDSEAQKKLDGHAWLLYDRNIFLEKNTKMTKIYQMTYCFPSEHE
ncbi:MAG: lasso peptide biosynthesis B2 protein [wastewater metagenome]|nr:lasso peptide biosynthesis B2 protein [Candidatus Loosdrechtia aerotolerans]